MIRRLRVQNFQSLADLDLDLAPFTVIVGESNSGKSAVRRALAALVRNDPAGGRVRAGETKAVVTVDLDDSIATWEKGTGRNAYSVIEAGQEAVVYDKPGASVPDPVASLLRMDVDLHLATQFDPPFLLTETASHAAKRLGGLTNIATLYEAIRESERQRKEAKKKASATAELADEAEVELSRYENLTAESAKLHEISSLLAVAHEADQAERTLATASAEARRVQKLSDEAHYRVAQIGPIDDQIAAVRRAKQAVEAEQTLSSALNSARHCEIQAQPVATVPDINIDAVSNLVVVSENLQVAAEKAVRAAQTRDRHLSLVQQHHAEADEILNALAEITTCPTCGQPMVHEEAA